MCVPREWHPKRILDHVTNFNNWCATMFKPSTMIVHDESIIWWYGIRGEWINAGLPIICISICMD